MNFEEQPVDPTGDGCAREVWHLRPVTAASGALPARRLHAVGRIEHERLAGRAHRRKSRVVDDQRAVAEARPTFGQQHVAATDAGEFVDDVGRVLGGEELSLLDVDGLAGAAAREQQVGLPAEECWDLQAVDDVA